MSPTPAGLLEQTDCISRNLLKVNMSYLTWEINLDAIMTLLDFYQYFVLNFSFTI